MNEGQPISHEQLQQSEVVDKSESEYFKNLSNRLLKRTAVFMTWYPVFCAGFETLVGEVIKNPGIGPLPGAVTGITLGTLMTAKEMWSIRDEKFLKDNSNTDKK